MSFVAFLAIFSCKEADYLIYDTTQQDGIYLKYSYEENYADSVFYNFGFSSITEFEKSVEVAIMGAPKSYERKIKVDVVSSLYANDTFEAASSEYYSVPAEVTLPADSLSVMIPITLKRHADLENKRVVLGINIVNSEDFTVRGVDRYIVTYDDNTPPTPAWWQDWRFGAFTKEKGQKFFEFFWASKEKDPYTYSIIEDRWGSELDIAPNSAGSSPLSAYRIYFNIHLWVPMYEYAVANPQLGWEIDEPIW